MKRNSKLSEKKHQIIKELKSIGYNPKYKGFKYLVDSILLSYIYQDEMINNLQGIIYPIISKKYNISVQNIKNNIINATSNMYYECDIEKLKAYFSFYDDIKPTVKEVISTVVNKL